MSTEKDDAITDDESTSPPVPAVVDVEALVNEAVANINDIFRRTVYDGVLEIGQYLLEHFFNNSIEDATSRNPQKRVSYRKLCEREDLLVHPGRLSEMVRVAAQEKFLTDSEINPEALSYTHKAELIKLPNDALKIGLANKTVAENLSTRALGELVDAERAKLLPTTIDSAYKASKHYLKIVSGLFKKLAEMSLELDVTKFKNVGDDRGDKLLKETATVIDEMGRRLEELEKFADTLTKLKEESAAKKLAAKKRSSKTA